MPKSKRRQDIAAAKAARRAQAHAQRERELRERNEIARQDALKSRRAA